MSIIKLLENEKTFNSARNINYLFQPSNTKTNNLVVIFSAFNPKGAPPAYNYIRTLQNFDVNKLFILDNHGERGCYYLGENRVFDVEASVVALITHIANQNDILHENIICCGSSKGGYTSLYYSIKYGFGHAIVGAPQTYLGKYLSQADEYPTLEFIAGDSNEESIQFLDGLLFDLVKQTKKIPHLTIHVGSGDHHYKGHVLPFVEHLKNHGYDCYLDVKDYTDHGEVKYYQEILIKQLKDKIPSLKDTFEIEIVELNHNGIEVELKAKVNREAKFAWYIFKDGERISVQWYKDESELFYKAEGSGVYKFIAFAKDNVGNVCSTETGDIII